MVLILSAAVAWTDLTVVILLKPRRRRRGSSVVASAPDPPEPTPYRPHKPWRRTRPSAGQPSVGRAGCASRKSAAKAQALQQCMTPRASNNSIGNIPSSVIRFWEQTWMPGRHSDSLPSTLPLSRASSYRRSDYRAGLFCLTDEFLSQAGRKCTVRMLLFAYVLTYTGMVADCPGRSAISRSERLALAKISSICSGVWVK